VSLLTGIGFTMSLFIGTLAFEHGGFEHGAAVRLGVLAGSTIAAVAGYLVLRRALPAAAAED
jgi:NhaA family Na+:H+ antiporter